MDSKKSSDDIAVSFDRVSLAFDDHVILRDVSFTLSRGSMVMLCGASGVGKSLILKLILGLSPPDAGAITVNGQTVKPTRENGYLAIKRSWKAGDTIAFELPLKPQRVYASEKIAADVGRVALRYGPLVYNIEKVDQDIEALLGYTAGATLIHADDLALSA